MNETRALNYTIGGKTRSGRGIALIYGQSATCGVYRDEAGLVHFETISETFTPVESVANQRFDALSARVKECLPAKAHTKVRDVLALALYRGLSAPDESAAGAALLDAERYIERAISLRARLWYSGSGTVAAVVLALTGWLAWPQDGSELALPLIGALGGGAGAWTSVLQRLSQLAPPTAVETPFAHGFQGASRILLGAVFGILAVAAIKADLLLGVASSSLWATGVVAYLAGFSERFVPEFLSKLEGKVLENQ